MSWHWKWGRFGPAERAEGQTDLADAEAARATTLAAAGVCLAVFGRNPLAKLPTHKITDPDYKASFLERVSENARTLAWRTPG